MSTAASSQIDHQPGGYGTPEQSVPRASMGDRLRAHGITPTHQRIQIANVLFERGEHLTADRILSLVNVRYAESSKATVYNTLKLFVEKGLIRELKVDSTCVMYDPNTEPHHHFHDVETGRLTDIPADEVRLAGMPTLPPGTVVEGVDIIIRTRPA